MLEKLKALFKSYTQQGEPLTGTINLRIKTGGADMAKKAKFVVFKSEENDLWYFHLRSGNGKIIAQSEGYTRKRNALNGIKAIKSCAAKAEILED
jgi:uncharacterized protein YegP (UPF0339 family)